MRFRYVSLLPTLRYASLQLLRIFFAAFRAADIAADIDAAAR